jgi:DNA-binding IscR family transcriptional regulator
VAEIVTSLEGPIALTDCSTDVEGVCEIETCCPIKNNQRIISKVVRGALEKVMLADLIEPMQLTVIKDAEGHQVPAVKFHSGRVQ